jgi:hypothetical protein
MMTTTDVHRAGRPEQPEGGSQLSVARLRLLAPSALTGLEAVVAMALFLLVGFAVYGLHVVRGGYMLDDWAFGSERDHADGVWALAKTLLDADSALISAGGRPGAALYFASTQILFGNNVAFLLAIVVALGALMSWSLFLVLREFGVVRLHAGMIAGLVLVFPASDSVRLWPAASQSMVAGSFFFIGLLVAIRAFVADGRNAFALHCVSVACFAASLLTYEVWAGLIALSALAYRLRVPARRALRRWLVDICTVVAALVYVKSTSKVKTVNSSLSDLVDRARNIQGEARSLFEQLGIQHGPSRLPASLAVLALLGCGALAYRLSRYDPVRMELRRWLATAAAGLVVVGAGYALFVAATDSFYMPLRPGIGNRANVVASIGYVMVFYALAMLVGLAALRALSAIRRTALAVQWASVAGISVAVILAVLWVPEVQRDRGAWDRAYALDLKTLRALRAFPRPEARTTFYTFGVPGETAPLVYSFTSSWDLTGAIRTLWHDQTLAGVPSASLRPDFPGNTAERSGIACDAGWVMPRGFLWTARDASPYGRTVFVDVATGKFEIIRDPAQCRLAVSRYLAG